MKLIMRAFAPIVENIFGRLNIYNVIRLFTIIIELLYGGYYIILYITVILDIGNYLI